MKEPKWKFLAFQEAIRKHLVACVSWESLGMTENCQLQKLNLIYPSLYVPLQDKMLTWPPFEHNLCSRTLFYSMIKPALKGRRTLKGMRVCHTWM